MKDIRTQAYVNFYAAIGNMEAYCKEDLAAKELASKKNISVRFKVNDGPDGVLTFKDGAASTKPYVAGDSVDIGLYCPTPEAFNAVVDGKGTPIPFKGFTKLGFLLDKKSAFNVLSSNMANIMRMKEFKTAEEKRLSTVLAFYAMGAAIVEIGNNEERGKIAMKKIVDGEISLEIPNEAYATITKKDGKLSYKREKCENPRAIMSFKTIDIAKGVIDGKLDAMTCIGTGDIEMKGMIMMLDNVNRILNIVPAYLS